MVRLYDYYLGQTTCQYKVIVGFEENDFYPCIRLRDPPCHPDYKIKPEEQPTMLLCVDKEALLEGRLRLVEDRSKSRKYFESLQTQRLDRERLEREQQFEQARRERDQQQLEQKRWDEQ